MDIKDFSIKNNKLIVKPIESESKDKNIRIGNIVKLDTGLLKNYKPRDEILYYKNKIGTFNISKRYSLNYYSNDLDIISTKNIIGKKLHKGFL